MNDLTYWKMQRDADGLVWLALDKPGTSTNVLSSEVLVELGALVGELAANPPRAVILSSAKKNGFVAGADIREFTAFKGSVQVEPVRLHAGRAGLAAQSL